MHLSRRSRGRISVHGKVVVVIAVAARVAKVEDHHVVSMAHDQSVALVRTDNKRPKVNAKSVRRAQAENQKVAIAINSAVAVTNNADHVHKDNRLKVLTVNTSMRRSRIHHVLAENRE